MSVPRILVTRVHQAKRSARRGQITKLKIGSVCGGPWGGGQRTQDRAGGRALAGPVHGRDKNRGKGRGPCMQEPYQERAGNEAGKGGDIVFL